MSDLTGPHVPRAEPFGRWVACPAHTYPDPAAALTNWDAWSVCPACRYVPVICCAACGGRAPWPCPAVTAAAV